MSWLLKDATVLSSALILGSGMHSWPLARRKLFEQEQALILNQHRFITSFFLRNDSLLMKCDESMVVVSLSRLKPNRIGGVSFKTACWVLIPSQIAGHVEVHIGDQLEIKN